MYIVIKPEFLENYPSDIYYYNYSIGLAHHKLEDLDEKPYRNEVVWFADDLRHMLRERSGIREFFGIDSEDVDELPHETLQEYVKNYTLVRKGRGADKIYAFLKREHLVHSLKEANRALSYTPRESDGYVRFLDNAKRLQKEYYKNSFTPAKRKLFDKRIEEILKPSFFNFYGEENVEFKIEEGGIDVIVNYGDTYIASLSKKHPILGLFLKFRFDVSSYRGGFGVTELFGLRTKVTLSENRKSYVHSHLPRSPTAMFQPFCVGQSQAGNFAIVSLKLKDTEKAIEDLDEYLVLVDHLIQFEDKDNPYMLFSDITPALPPPLMHYDFFYDLRNNRHLLLSNSEIKFNYSDSDNEQIYISVKEQGSFVDLLPSSLVAIKLKSGEYVDYNEYKRVIIDLPDLSDGEDYISKKEIDVTFKGQKLEKTIIPDNNQSLDKDLTPCIRPEVEENLNREYSTKIINQIQKYVNEKERQENQTEVTAN